MCERLVADPKSPRSTHRQPAVGGPPHVVLRGHADEGPDVAVVDLLHAEVHRVDAGHVEHEPLGQ
eukprot:9154004-Pyramimonas_sp.AAC.1